MTVLSIPRDCRSIREDAAPLDLADLVCVLHCCHALRGASIGSGRGLRISDAKATLATLGLEFGDWIWSAAVEAFARAGQEVQP